ncbi:MAG: NAD(P)-binding domain-containing protein [Pirellulales bacterium]
MPPKLSERATATRPSDSATAEKFCILGAGSSGLAVAKNFRAMGIPFDCLEREDDVGGNWYYGTRASSVYRSTRLISSKPLTEYCDFPMPEHYPDHPDQDMVWRYLRSYAEHFGLYQHVQFNTSVVQIRAESREQGAGRENENLPASSSLLPASCGWIVTLASGERRRYRGVVIANGHNWDPRWPNYPGHFDGQVLHSSQYKTPDVLAGRRVLVVGGGNSGYDVATESARHADATFHSLRRSYALLPRYFRGRRVDQDGEWMLRWRLPLWLRRLSIARVCRLAWQPQLPPLADHAFFETHPTINGRWPLDVHRGAIVAKPDVQELLGRDVLFADGSRETVDLIIYATGFNISFPFLDVERLNWRNGRPELYLNVFHPERDDLFVVGLIQPDSGQFGLVDCQARLIAAYLQGLKQKRRGATRLQAAKRNNGQHLSNGIRYVDSPRHLLEVEHFSYRRQLLQWVNRLR